MTIFRTITKDDRDRFADLTPRDVPFCTIDPGAAGVVLYWSEPLSAGPWPRPPDVRRSLGSRASGHNDAADVVDRLSVDLVLIEDQFIGRGKGARSTITLVQAAGMILGHILRARPVREVAWIPPWAWQARLRRVGDAKQTSTDAAIRRLGSAWVNGQGPSELQQACCDAFNIADYYEEVTRVQTNHDRGRGGDPALGF